MRFLRLLPILFLTIPALSQPVATESIPLGVRYQLMKTSSETYNEYKVIKEFQLDRFWALTKDTLTAHKAVLAERTRELANMKAEADRLRLVLEQKEIAQADLVYESDHITVLGISFVKRTFLLITAILFIGFILSIAFVSGRMRLMMASVREKMDLANIALQELEEFKRKSLEKQIKLSRELQNERNKLVELRRG